MAIPYDNFINWAESRFDSVVVRGGNVYLNSIFADDNKHHLSCSPNGGKKHIDHGCYRCFYTEKTGTLVGLVMQVDNCDYDMALEILGVGDTSLALLESKVAAFFDKQQGIMPEVNPLSENTLKLPENTFRIDALVEGDYFKEAAALYLLGRKIPTTGKYVCKDGLYRNRIVIPYYDREGNLIYFNARTLGTGKSVVRYMGPPASCGVGKSDVVYVPNWSCPKLYLTEGEFDADSIAQTSFCGGALGGKAISEKQIELLRGYEICLCLDNDKHGRPATMLIGQMLVAAGFIVSYVRPPGTFKDWNEMLVKVGPDVMEAYIERHEKPFDQWTADLTEMAI